MQPCRPTDAKAHRSVDPQTGHAGLTATTDASLDSERRLSRFVNPERVAPSLDILAELAADRARDRER